MKRKKHTLLCLLLAAAFVSGCAQKHKEGEPDVISSMKMNQDETLTVVANRKQIEDKGDCIMKSLQTIKIKRILQNSLSKNVRIILFSLLDSLQIMGMPPA